MSPITGSDQPKMLILLCNSTVSMGQQGRMIRLEVGCSIQLSYGSAWVLLAASPGVDQALTTDIRQLTYR
jgi:hypothetical protein